MGARKYFLLGRFTAFAMTMWCHCKSALLMGNPTGHIVIASQRRGDPIKDILLGSRQPLARYSRNRPL